MTSSELKSKLQKTLDFLESELTQIRTGRATPALVEGISVEAYGTKMAIRELGSISAVDSQNIVISPWDKGVVDAIDKALRESDLNINPVVDGDLIRVPVPAPTEERRKEFAKVISTKLEEARSAIRNIRQEAVKAIDKKFSAKEIGEDDKFKMKEDVEEIIKEFNERASALGEAKTKDVMTV